MGEPVHIVGAEINTWILVFYPNTESRLARWLSFGHFKHVAAVAYVGGMKLWVTYDVAFAGTKIGIVPDHQVDALHGFLEGATLVRMERKPEKPRWWPPLFGWCVPSVDRLLAANSMSLRCDAFYRHCLANGGIILNGERITQGPVIADRSDFGSAATAGAAE